MTKNSVKRAALYARISKSDPAVDKVENQIAELRLIAEANGYEVVAEFEDDDTSAYKGQVLRPGYVSLINGLRDSLFDVVMATEPQRFTRGSPSELEILAYELTKTNAVLHTRSAGLQDPSKITTLALMQIMDIIGGLEVASKIERQRARNAEDINKGIPTKGLRPFGWEKDRITIRESEAAHIRSAYKAILEDGVSVWGISQLWNSIGVKTDSMTRPRKSRTSGKVEPPSGIWTTTTVRQLLIRPRNAGILTSEGKEMPTSLIAPIVSREDYDALKIAIRGENKIAGPKPKYLLGGILECPCGARMNASKSNSQRPGKHRHSYQIYRCRLYGFDKSKKHATIQLKTADAATRDWIVEDIGLGITKIKPTTPAALLPIKTKIAELRAEQDRVSELYAEGLGDKQKLSGRLRSLKVKIAESEVIYAEIVGGLGIENALDAFRTALAKLDDLAGDDEINFELSKGFTAWDSLDIDQQRSIIKSNYSIRLQSGGRGADRLIFEANKPIS